LHFEDEPGLLQLYQAFVTNSFDEKAGWLKEPQKD
jgi:hypothetical protein